MGRETYHRVDTTDYSLAVDSISLQVHRTVFSLQLESDQ